MSSVRLDEVLAAIAVEEAAARGETVVADDLLGALDALAKGVRMPPTWTLTEAVARLNLHLFQTEGFGPAKEDYGQPESSLLDQVLQRRRGLPILMCVLYMEVARRVGVSVDGVGFPGHFLVSPRDGESRFFLDPYHEGRVLDPDRLREQLGRIRNRQVPADELEHVLRPVGPLHIQVRLNNNLKGAFLRQDDIDGAIRATARMLQVAPHLQGEQRDLALMRVHQGRRQEAVDGLLAYLDTFDAAPEREDLETLLAELEAGL